MLRKKVHFLSINIFKRRTLNVAPAILKMAVSYVTVAFPFRAQMRRKCGGAASPRFSRELLLVKKTYRGRINKCRKCRNKCARDIYIYRERVIRRKVNVEWNR